MLWNKLVDRCQLFEPGVNRSLFKELLKEAEIDLAKNLAIFERKLWIRAPFTFTYDTGSGGDEVVTEVRNNAYYQLPQDFLRIKWVYVDGQNIPPISQNEVKHNSENKIDTGTPTGYYVHNDKIHFNTTPTTNDILVEYYASLTSKIRNKDFILNDITSIEIDDDDEGIIYDDTVMGAVSGDATTSNRSSAQASKHIIDDDVEKKSDPENTRRETYYGFAIDIDIDDPNELKTSSLSCILDGHKTSIMAVGETIHGYGTYIYTDGPQGQKGGIVTIANFRDIAPIIPENYHKELCLYALHIATNNPEYQKQWLMFQQHLEAQDLDRDLIHTIKGVV